MYVCYICDGNNNIKIYPHENSNDKSLYFDDNTCM